VTSINSLLPDHKNARRRTDRSASLIKESIDRYGAARSIVIDEDNRILAGNGTIEGAKAAGIKNVRIIETDGDEIIAVRRTGLTEDQKIGLALADNRTSDLSEWDQEMLRRLSEEHDISPWFNDEDLNELLAITELPPEQGKTDPDDVPEPPEQPIAKPGDLWILGNHRLLCGDSKDTHAVERLLDGKRPDAIFTDPPYGIGIDGHVQFTSKTNSKQNRKAHVFKGWDADRPAAETFNLILGYQVPTAIFGANYFTDLLPPSKGWIFWGKGQDGMLDASDGELAWTNLEKAIRVVTVNRAALNKDGAVHPTQKPTEVVAFSLEYLEAGKVVLDLFGGSGTTLIVCEQTGRSARLMELDPAYCDVIVKRWEDFTGNTAVCHPADSHFTQPEEVDF
jgi:16S rRNA G966 N2-methylase RsmD